MNGEEEYNQILRMKSWESKYSMLTRPFAPEYYYWSVVIILRNLIIAVLSIVFVPVPLYQACSTLSVLLVCVIIQLRRHPYRDGTGMNGLEVTSLGVASVLLFLGILFFAELGSFATASTILSVSATLLISCFLALFVKLAFQHINMMWPDWYDYLLRIPNLLPFGSSGNKRNEETHSAIGEVELVYPRLLVNTTTSLLNEADRKLQSDDTAVEQHFPAPRMVISPRWAKSIEPSRGGPSPSHIEMAEITSHPELDDNWTISPHPNSQASIPTTSSNFRPLLARWAAIARHVAKHHASIRNVDPTNVPSYVIMPTRKISRSLFGPSSSTTKTPPTNTPLRITNEVDTNNINNSNNNNNNSNNNSCTTELNNKENADICPPIFRILRGQPLADHESPLPMNTNDPDPSPQNLPDHPTHSTPPRRHSLSSLSSIPSFSQISTGEISSSLSEIHPA
jgi:hypothetical protein